MTSNLQNNPHLIAVLDLDGTLLERSTLSGENAAAVEVLKQRCQRVIIATGRNHHHAVAYHRQLKLSSPLVSSDGASIRSTHGNLLLQEHCLAVRTAKVIASAAKQKEISTLCFHREGIDILAKFDWSPDLERHCEIGKRFKRNSLHLPRFAYKLLLYSGNSSLLDCLQAELDEKLPTPVDVIRNGHNFLEFVPKGVSKVSALQYLAELYQFSSSDVIAFGDGANDVALLNWAGQSVCMHHGHETAKQAASFVAPASPAHNNFAAAVSALFTQ